MRRDLIFPIILLTALLCSCITNLSGEVERRNKVVHLSLDDVEVFSDLIRNQNEYDSLFQHPFMAFLRDLHREHGLRITLYTYEYFSDRDTRIEDMPLKYKNDFRNASDWLRIGFHSNRPLFDSLVTVSEFEQSYNNVNSAIAQFADSSMIASTLRLHYYFAPDSLLNAMTGVRTLLCADENNRLSYNLTLSEAKTVASGESIVKNDISYRRTDFRTDDNFLIPGYLKSLGTNDTLVIFAHEWKLWHPVENMNSRSAARRIKLRTSERVNRRLFKETVKWLNDAEYKFSFIE